MDEIHLGDSILKRYVSSGGRMVTCGSDAHDCDGIASGFVVLADKLEKYGLSTMVFRQRRPYVEQAG